MPEHHNHNSDSSKHEHSNSHDILLKAGLTTSGVVVAPYIGDALNLSSTTVPEIMHSFHHIGHGTGLAGGVNSLLESIPVIGETLAAGGISTALTSGVIGLGGVLLGNYLDKSQKNYDAKQIPWGKIIKYTALATSLLIALPSILTGISVGISYIASLMGAGSSVIPFLANTLGAVEGMHMANAGAGIGGMLTHLITCGGAALSVTGAIYADNKYEHEHHNKQIKKQHNIKTEIIDPPVIIRGEPCELSLRIQDASGKTLTDADLSETYTKKLHLLIVDKSLNDYHHIHPEYNAEKGVFTASFIPNTQNEYSVWSNFKLQENGQNIVSQNTIPSLRNYNIAPSIQHTNIIETDDIKIELEATPPLTSGKDSNLLCKIISKSGKPVKLEEIMGAQAHLVGFTKDGDSMIHCHPLEEKISTKTDSQNAELKFHIAPEKEGFTKFFLQMKIKGKETIIPFGQYITPSPKLAEREDKRSNMAKLSHQHAM